MKKLSLPVAVLFVCFGGGSSIAACQIPLKKTRKCFAPNLTIVLLADHLVREPHSLHLVREPHSLRTGLAREHEFIRICVQVCMYALCLFCELCVC